MSWRGKDTPTLKRKELHPERRKCKVAFLILLKSSVKDWIFQRRNTRSKHGKDFACAVVWMVTTLVTVRLKPLLAWEKAGRLSLLELDSADSNFKFWPSCVLERRLRSLEHMVGRCWLVPTMALKLLKSQISCWPSLCPLLCSSSHCQRDLSVLYLLVF